MGLRFALPASAAVHVMVMAALLPPAASQPLSPLFVSLRHETVPASLPVPAERPVRQKEAVSSGKPAQAAQDVPAAVPVATAPNDSPTSPARPAENQAAAPAPVELPRYDAAYLANPPPPYPNSAKRRGIEGTVWLEARVGTGGEAQEVKLAASAGDTGLDEAALAAVRAWRFVPARRGSEAVEAWVRIPVVFRLN